MGAAEGRMRDRIETGEGTVKALNFGARERLGERVSDHVSTLAVDEAKKLVMDHLLAEPVIACVEVAVISFSSFGVPSGLAACFNADSVATRSVIFALFSARSSRVSSRVGSLRLSDDIVIMIDRVYR